MAYVGPQGLVEAKIVEGTCREKVGIKISLSKRDIVEFRYNLSSGHKPVDNSNTIHAVNEEFHKLAYGIT